MSLLIRFNVKNDTVFKPEHSFINLRANLLFRLSLAFAAFRQLNNFPSVFGTFLAIHKTTDKGFLLMIIRIGFPLKVKP